MSYCGISKKTKNISSTDNTPNQSTKFRTKNWFEINDDARARYNINTQIKFNTSMWLCGYSDAYVIVSGPITVAPQAGGNPDNVNKEVVFKNIAPFTNCTSEINDTRIDNAKDIDVAMPMDNLIEYSNIYSNTSESLW